MPNISVYSMGFHIGSQFFESIPCGILNNVNGPEALFPNLFVLRVALIIISGSFKPNSTSICSRVHMHSSQLYLGMLSMGVGHFPWGFICLTGDNVEMFVFANGLEMSITTTSFVLHDQFIFILFLDIWKNINSLQTGTLIKFQFCPNLFFLQVN